LLFFGLGPLARRVSVPMMTEVRTRVTAHHRIGEYFVVSMTPGNRPATGKDHADCARQIGCTYQWGISMRERANSLRVILYDQNTTVRLQRRDTL
jgi:hypothetical protein